MPSARSLSSEMTWCQAFNMVAGSGFPRKWNCNGRSLQVCAAPKRRFGTYSGPKGGNTKSAMDDRYAKLQSGSLSAGGSGCGLIVCLAHCLQYEAVSWLSP